MSISLTITADNAADFLTKVRGLFPLALPAGEVTAQPNFSVLGRGASGETPKPRGSRVTKTLTAGPWPTPKVETATSAAAPGPVQAMGAIPVEDADTTFGPLSDEHGMVAGEAKDEPEQVDLEDASAASSALPEEEPIPYAEARKLLHDGYLSQFFGVGLADAAARHVATIAEYERFKTEHFGGKSLKDLYAEGRAKTAVDAIHAQIAVKAAEAGK